MRRKQKKILEIIEKSLESVRKEAKAQKPVLKAEMREELRKEFVTKEEFFGEIGKLEQKMETIEQKIESIDRKIEFVRREMKILFYIRLAFMFLLNKGMIEFAFRILGLLK